MELHEQEVTLHPGSDIELTMRIRKDQKGALHICADLSGNTEVEGESRIERGKYRAFSNAVHSAVYAAPQRGVRIKPCYAIATNDQTGIVTCTIPANTAAEAEALLNYLSATPSRMSALEGR
jgi:hypothetical protein